MFAENTAVGTEQSYNWSARTLNILFWGKRRRLGKASNQNANMELRIQ
jgi:hypothetical protein